MDSRQNSVRRLPLIDDFIDGMKILPQLRARLQDDDIETLLCKLYTIARTKIGYDSAIENWPEAIPKIRRARKSMHDIKDWIEEASDRIERITKADPVQIKYLNDLTEAQLDPLFSDTLRDISEALRKMSAKAALVEAMIAANMHPAKRTESEKRLVKLHRLSASGDEERRFLRPKTPAVDHWFIGEAAACLAKYGGEISGKEKIIARLFEMIGEPGRTEGSISKELQRQSKRGRPALPLYGCPRDGHYGPDLLP
jgi:hypothetical protein